MGIRGPASHCSHKRIKWAQAHSTREALDRRFWLAEKVFYPAAPIPCLGQIGIERKRAIDQGGTYFEIPSNIRQCMPAVGEPDRVTLAQLHPPLRQPLPFRNLLPRACIPP